MDYTSRHSHLLVANKHSCGHCSLAIQALLVRKFSVPGERTCPLRTLSERTNRMVGVGLALFLSLPQVLNIIHAWYP